MAINKQYPSSRFNDFANDMSRDFEKFLDDTFDNVLTVLNGRLRIATPVDTGTLRLSWDTIKTSDTTAVLMNIQPYAAIIDAGRMEWPDGVTRGSKQADEGIIEPVLNDWQIIIDISANDAARDRS